MSTIAVVSLIEHPMRELTPARVAEYVPEARKNQLRVVPRAELEEYRRLLARVGEITAHWRNDCPPPGPVVMMFAESCP